MSDASGQAQQEQPQEQPKARRAGWGLILLESPRSLGLLRISFAVVFATTIPAIVLENSGIKDVLGVPTVYWLLVLSSLALVGLIVISIVLTIFQVNMLRKRIQRLVASIPEGPEPSPPPGVTAPAAPKAHQPTQQEMIAEVYTAIKNQGRTQFWTNLIWAVVGIFGGYVVGHLLPR